MKSATVSNHELTPGDLPAANQSIVHDVDKVSTTASNTDGTGTQPVQKSISDWPWGVIVSVLGLVLAGIAYSLGDAYYNAYLEKFSIHSGAFPVDHPTHFVLAVWGGLNATIALQKWLTGHVIKLLIATVACLAYFALPPVVFVGISRFFANRKRQIGRANALLDDRPSLRKYLGIVFVIAYLAGSPVWLFLFVPPFISIPSAIGESAGENVATTDKNDFDKGCGHSRAQCYQAMKNGKEIAHGYVIAQSPSRVALYYMGNTSQFSLGDVVLQTLDKAAAEAPSRP
jgi:hypothetical protein